MTRCSVGVVLHSSSSSASSTLLRAATASLTRAGVNADAIHSFTHDQALHHEKALSGLVALCGKPRQLAQHAAWLSLPASVLAGPRFTDALTEAELACNRGEAPRTRALCPTQSEGAGLYGSSALQEVACPRILDRSSKRLGREAVLTLLNASSQPPLASGDKRHCWVNYIFTNVSRGPDHPLGLLSVPMARAGRGPNSAASTAMRDQRRGAAKGLRNTTYARAGLRGLIDLLEIDHLVHRYKQGAESFLYEFDGLDMYQRRAADFSF